MYCTRPAIRSVIAGPRPRYGTWVTFTPSMALSRMQLTCEAEPAPAEANWILSWFAFT